MPLAFSTYPDENDVADKLRSSKLWPYNADDAERALFQAAIGAASAAEEWEKRVAWEPFLASYFNNGAAMMRPFERHEVEREGVLSFRAAAQSISGISMGTATIDPARYRLLFGDRVAYKPPYTGIRFIGGYGYGNGYDLGWSSGALSMIEVTGVWGRYAEVPAFAWQQIQQYAALIALTSVENVQNIASISMDSFSKAFDTVGVISQQDLLKEWGKDFLHGVVQYRRGVAV